MGILTRMVIRTLQLPVPGLTVAQARVLAVQGKEKESSDTRTPASSTKNSKDNNGDESNGADSLL